MEIVAPTPQKPAKVELPQVYQNSFNVSLTHNKAMTVVTRPSKNSFSPGKFTRSASASSKPTTASWRS